MTIDQLVEKYGYTTPDGDDVILIDDLIELTVTHAIVPREPSKKVLSAGMDKVYGRFGTASSRTTEAYKAMIKAAEND